MSSQTKSQEMYITKKKCEQCGRKLWKGYFVMIPDTIQSMLIRVVCWRCKIASLKK